MSATSHIEWTDATWNPTVGCTKVSPGCDHCYAETLVNRFAGSNSGFPNRFDEMHLRGDATLTLPLRWRAPKRIFVNSLSDLFHDDVPDEFIARVFAVMALAPQHTFQLLTKRHARMRSLLSSIDFQEDVQNAIAWIENPQEISVMTRLRWPLPNVWLGVSAEDQHWYNIRWPALRDTPAAVRFISFEPLLDEVSMLANSTVDQWPMPDWAIVGGESGPGARPMQPRWARQLRDECVSLYIPFLFKQWGAHAPVYVGDAAAVMERVGKKAAGRQLDGRTWDEYPAGAA